ncbi:MAG: ABC transporter substrate-binding protein [Puniceicoccales bacterium]|jgi:putative ABC transport system substrate-binding protein|nr:ABC transporter substrate-binding protein [Puniceicoccales bacterium]
MGMGIRFMALIAGILLFFPADFRGKSEGEKINQSVYILKIIDHGALNETARGVRDSLIGKSVKIAEESAQGNPSLALQIAQKISGQRPTVVVAIGTVAAQSFMRHMGGEYGPNVLIFSSITNPGAAGLTQHRRVGGVSNFIPIEPQLALFKRIQPSLKKLGILYNPGEANSQEIVKILRNICGKFQIKLVEQVALKTSEIPQAAAKLANSADAIFISNDNTALAAIRSVIKMANRKKIPVYVSDTDAVELGALAALGPNQYQIGLQTGRMVNGVLSGDLGEDLPMEQAESMELHINLSAARLLGIVIGDPILAEAKRIYQ